MKQISVLSRTQRIVVDPVTSDITVTFAGPMGPPGIDAGGAASYDYTQVIASTSWVINHNLGFYPSVTAFDDLGRVIEPAIIHHSLVQLELQLLTPRAGTAHLS